LTDYITEEEQIELIKNWFKQYSLVIVAGIAIAFLIVFAWRTLEARHQQKLTHASNIYDEMLAARSQSDIKDTKANASKIYTNYQNTVYGTMAALMLGRDAAISKNYTEAEKHFQWVINHSESSAFAQIARLRLARVYLSNKNPQKALELLQTVDDLSFKGLIKEERGDAYIALKQPNKALKAYSEALIDLPNAAVIRPILQIKRDNLVTASPQVS